jgi:hypothetical protein
VVEKGAAVGVGRRDVTGRDDRKAAVRNRRESIVEGQETALDNASCRESFQSAVSRGRSYNADTIRDGREV